MNIISGQTPDAPHPVPLRVVDGHLVDGHTKISSLRTAGVKFVISGGVVYDIRHGSFKAHLRPGMKSEPIDSKRVEKFETPDGQLFDTQSEAAYHVVGMTVRQFLTDGGLSPQQADVACDALSRSANTREIVVRWLSLCLQMEAGQP